MSAVIVSSNTKEDLPTEPVSRAEGIENRQRAIELGHVYYLGQACKHGHSGRRYTRPKGKARKVGHCVECENARNAARRADPEYQAEESVRTAARLRDKRANDPAWRAETNARLRDKRANDPAWRAEENARHAARRRGRRANDPEYRAETNARNAARRAIKLGAEADLNAAERAELEGIYLFKAAMGITRDWHEEHRISLTNGGKHHPGNMALMLAGPNIAKGNRDIEWMLGECNGPEYDEHGRRNDLGEYDPNHPSFDLDASVQLPCPLNLVAMCKQPEGKYEPHQGVAECERRRN